MITKKNIMSVIIILTVSFVTSHSKEFAIDRLNMLMESIGTFKANFEQTIINCQGQVIEVSRGNFLFKRPKKFRWNYRRPYNQQLIADGQRVWFYDIDLKQITVSAQNETLANTPAILLSKIIHLNHRYIFTDVSLKNELMRIELVPKDARSMFPTIILAFDSNGLQQMVMKDGFEQYTRLDFTQVSKNISIKNNVFIFTPPEGIDVVGSPGL